MRPGHVPAEPLLRRIDQRLATFTEEDDRLGYIRYLEHNITGTEDFLRKLRAKTEIPFSMADNILVALGDPLNEWMQDDLRSYYYSCDVDCLGSYIKGSEGYAERSVQLTREINRLKESLTIPEIVEVIGMSYAAVCHRLYREPYKSSVGTTTKREMADLPVHGASV